MLRQALSHVRSSIAPALAGLALAAAPLAAQVTAGRAVTLDQGAVAGAALSTLTDGAFQPDQTQWTSGSVYWNGTTTRLLIDLGGIFDLTGIIAQTDHNDTYRIEFRNPTTSLFSSFFAFSPSDAFGLRTYPNPANNAEIGSLGGTFRADQIRFSAVSGDNSYSVTEIQLYGTAASVNTTVPESRPPWR